MEVQKTPSQAYKTEGVTTGHGATHELKAQSELYGDIQNYAEMA